MIDVQPIRKLEDKCCLNEYFWILFFYSPTISEGTGVKRHKTKNMFCNNNNNNEVVTFHKTLITMLTWKF